MKAKTSRVKVYMLTSLDEEACSLMGAKKTTPEEIQSLISHHNGSMAVIRNASILVK
jgi:hypothetical protein